MKKQRLEDLLHRVLSEDTSLAELSQRQPLEACAFGIVAGIEITRLHSPGAKHIEDGLFHSPLPVEMPGRLADALVEAANVDKD